MDAINNAEILEVELYDVHNIIFEYGDIKLADNEVRSNNLEVINKEYSEKVNYEIVSKDNRDVKGIFEKYGNRILVKYKSKEILVKN